MGSGASTLSTPIKRYIKNEFDRVRKCRNPDMTQDYLTLDQIFMLQPPPIMPMDFTHLGTLFVVNRNLDGKFTLDDLFAFAAFCESKRRVFDSHEFLIQIQGLCSYVMWEYNIKNGHGVVEEWLFKCVAANGPLRKFDRVPNVVFILRDNILPLYKILRVDRAFSISFHDFFDLMQLASEENCGFDMMDEEFDDVIPDRILLHFLHACTASFMQMMHDIGCVAKE